MKNRISFCVNACKKSTFRFIGGLQNVLRFLYYFSGSRADIQADFVNIHNRILLIGYINNKIRYISLTLMSDAANVRNLLEKVSDCLYLTFCRQHD